MALTKTAIILGAGALALIFLSKKREIVVPASAYLPYEPSKPNGSTAPPISPDGSTVPDGEASKPAPAPWLGYDPFPALALALVVSPSGVEWWTKHPQSGRWGKSTSNFSANEGYKSIGMLARNHNVIEVQDNRGNPLWKSFVWNIYGFPISTPLQMFV